MSQRTAIERASQRDREWCARLMAANAPWITLRRGVKACRRQLERPDLELYVACKERHRRGFILLDPHGVAGSPYVVAVAVEARERGRGVGSQLLAFAESRFAGHRHLFLCVSSFNRRAEKLYRKLGYERVAELKGHVVEAHSELLLRKKLS